MNAVRVLLHDIYRAIGAVRYARGTGEIAISVPVAAPLPDEIALVVEDLDEIQRFIGHVQVVIGVEVHAHRHLELVVAVTGACAELAQPVLVERADLDADAARDHGPHPGQDENTAVRAERDVVRVVEPAADGLVGVESDGLEVFHRVLFAFVALTN